MFLYWLHVGCSWGVGFPASGGVGVHLLSFFGFSRMVSCVDHFGNVIVGWVSGSWISVDFVGAFVFHSTIVLEGDCVAPSESPTVIWWSSELLWDLGRCNAELPRFSDR